MRMTVLALAMAITPQLRATMHRAFRPGDFEIVWTDTPAEAVEASITRNPGLVVLDVDESVHAGRTILENLRALNPGTPMVLLAEDPPAPGQGIADTGIAVLRKPIGAAALADTANALLKASSRDSAPRANEDADPPPAAPNAERFREMVRARYDTPFEFSPSYLHWGINE